jgi:hypothetical protein
VTLSASIANVEGAKFDPVAGTLDFTPSWKWVDTRSPALEIIVTAEGQELDTGKQRVSTAKVLYQIEEQTSFKRELVPIFMLPPQPSPVPGLEDPEGHNCVSCHDGGLNAPAGMDFHAASIYDQLVNHDVAPTGFLAAECGALADMGVKRVTPGDLTKSLWFMKISGTDGAGNPGPPCGVQMPENQDFYFLTVSDEDTWLSCPNGVNSCRTALNCVSTDVDCKLESRWVRKARLWILAMAPNN